MIWPTWKIHFLFGPTTIFRTDILELAVEVTIQVRTGKWETLSSELKGDPRKVKSPPNLWRARWPHLRWKPLPKVLKLFCNKDSCTKCQAFKIIFESVNSLIQICPIVSGKCYVRYFCMCLKKIPGAGSYRFFSVFGPSHTQVQKYETVITNGDIKYHIDFYCKAFF